MALCLAIGMLGSLTLVTPVLAAAPLGQNIWLRANANSQYVSADQNLANVQLVANRASASGWEVFTVVDEGGGLVALRASNGMYVSADSSLATYAPLVANRPVASTWEKFQWIDAGSGQVQLKAQTNGLFVSADLNRATDLVADRATPSTWETFTWGTGSTPPTAPPTSAPTLSGWNLVWSDEFNGTSVNTSNWGYNTGCSGWGNNEWEDYTAGANSSVSGGFLTITAQMKPGAALGPCGMTSSRMLTSGKHSWQYGKFEARIAMPVGQGTWPAFWMLGNNGTWPSDGEMDIMEHIDNVSWNAGSLHWSGGDATQTLNVSNLTGYHTYGMEWDASTIRFYVDSTYYETVNISGAAQPAFHQPAFILLNLAIGGNWPGNPTSTNIMPARMSVDYVRVYQH
jgi:beta-glucanase (GH16 family)